jgi:hypothetical protein
VCVAVSSKKWSRKQSQLNVQGVTNPAATVYNENMWTLKSAPPKIDNSDANNVNIAKMDKTDKDAGNFVLYVFLFLSL